MESEHLLDDLALAGELERLLMDFRLVLMLFAWAGSWDVGDAQVFAFPPSIYRLFSDDCAG